MMKVFLLYRDRDFDPSQPLPPKTEDLVQDLALQPLFEGMAQGDKFLFEVVRQVMLSRLDDIDAILYRQEILKDCLEHPDIVRQIYEIPLQFQERKRRRWLWISPRHSSPSAILNGARTLLEATIDLLRRLRKLADQNVNTFESQGFRRFFSMLQQELDDEYLAAMEAHLERLHFPRGVLLSAQLGRGNEGTNYVLCKSNDADQGWIQRLIAPRSPSYSYTLPPRDNAGARALGELRDRGLARVANAVAQGAEHVESFLNVLQQELAFYIGCLNLSEQLTALGAPVTFPQPVAAARRRFSCAGLYDVSLALTMGGSVVGNDINADGKSLVIITGPNRGGKTVFLRSAGLAQIMMQCGMFVPAVSFTASLSTGIFTHFRREEDKTMESGKFEEELKRMSQVVDHLTPNALILLNESLAATNEREGSEIASQIVDALLEKRIRVFYVTHLYEFAHHFFAKQQDNVLFLRAERLPDGRRTFKLKKAEPLKTSFGIDLYHKTFAGERSN